MPKGQGPTARMTERMTLLETQISKMPDSYDALEKVRRKFKSLLKMDKGQEVTSMKRIKMKRRLDKIGRSLAKNTKKIGEKPGL